MNFLKKGPELKLSELKIPDVIVDLFYDLRDRHLLPLVALLAIAIVAVPIALSGSGSEEETGPIATPSAAPPHSSLVVAKAAPGLRDYRKRLDGNSAKDPFEQQYAGKEGEGNTAQSTGSSESESSTDGGTTSTETTSSGGGEPVPGSGKLTYFSFAIDVRVVSEGPQAGAGTSSEETLSAESPAATASAKDNVSVRRNLPQLTMLPSRETPAAIFMGVTKDRKKALLMVSSDVEALFGDGVCVLGSETCQMVALEPGLPETFVYGPQQRTFRIEVLKIRLVTTDHLNRAPLGKPKKNSDG